MKIMMGKIFAFWVCTITSIYCLGQVKPKLSREEVINQYEKIIGVAIPSELMDLYNHDSIKTKEYIDFDFYNYGTFRFLNISNITEISLSEIGNYEGIDIYGRYYRKMKKGEISKEQYESIFDKVEHDPLIASKTISKNLHRYYGDLLNMKYYVVIANKGYYGYNYIFYAFNSAKEYLGLYYYDVQNCEFPYYLGNSLKEVIDIQGLIEGTVKHFDPHNYIKQNLQKDYYIKLPGSYGTRVKDLDLEALQKFYAYIAKKTYGDDITITKDSNMVEFTVTDWYCSRKYSISDNIILREAIRGLNVFLDIRRGRFEREEFFSYQLLEINGTFYVALLTTSEIEDFAKKGLLKHQYFTMPITVFTPKEGKNIKIKAPSKFDDNTKKQFENDFN